jgi:alginate O-acetyltransferase complex protein AlgI
LFYAWGEPAYVLLMLLSVVFNWQFGKLIGATDSTVARNRWLVVAIAFNLGMLIFFKYASFLLVSFGLAPLLRNTSVGFLLVLPLPIGVSFFTFQALSYLLDVHRGKFASEKSLLNLGTYISMFPQLIAGPIVRYEQIKEELHALNKDYGRLIVGVRLFTIGLAFKVLLANTFAKDADYVFSLDAAMLTASLAWLGAFSYSFQIYFDFAGYSLMAIGLGKCIGFTFPINFDRPYIARSVTDFWRRWHISLSSWFRDYLYIPLGGNRKGPVRTYFNLFVVFFLCGLWHGAAWNFAIWGCFHGIFLIIEKWAGDVRIRVPEILRHFYTLAVIIVSWVIFRSESFDQTIHFLGAMIGLNSTPAYLAMELFGWGYLLMFIVGARISVLHVDLESPPSLRNSFLTSLIYALMFLCCVLALIVGTHNPFIYFRF